MQPSDLSAHNAIVTSAALSTWRFVDGWECPVRWKIASGNMLLTRQLALQGQGIALLPDFMLDIDLYQGRLVRILADHELEEADAWIVSSKQRHLSVAVQAVSNFLVGATQLPLRIRSPIAIDSVQQSSPADTEIS